MTPTPTELHLVVTCREIGCIADSNGHFTAGLARLIDNGDKELLSMTVAELLSLSQEYREIFNRVHGS